MTKKKLKITGCFLRVFLVMFCVVNSSDWNWKNEKNNFCLELKKKLVA